VLTLPLGGRTTHHPAKPPCGAGGAERTVGPDAFACRSIPRTSMTRSCSVPSGRDSVLRTINDAGLNLIKSFEGCRLAAYQDVAGIWTIGYGHIRGVREGMTITEQQATQYLQEDLADTEGAVDWMTSAAPTTNNQYAAMVSLCFNIGSGNFKTSSVLRFHLARDYASAADAFLLWDKSNVDGQLVEVQGLLSRRRAERDLYLTQDAM
jgi:lysozyme